MEPFEECQFARLLADGTPVVRLHGVEREVEIDGINVPQPPPPLYVELFERGLLRLGKPLRCIIRDRLSTGRIRAKFFYFGWHDKSGDVWLDLALALLDEGVVRVAVRQFPEREEYLLHEPKASGN
jgi:hypothetical protein